MIKDNNTFQTVAILMAGMVLIVACAGTLSKSEIEAEPDVIESLLTYRKEFTLMAGDDLNVVVYRNSDLSTQASIRPDGFISLPIIDDVKAAGLTVSELDEKITDLYAPRFIDPEVTVIVMNVREPVSYVFGEVGRPAPVSLRDGRTAAQAIAMAGGMTRSAAKGSVALIRLNDKGKLVAYRIGGKKEGQPSYFTTLHNIALQPDDLIFVPESKRSQFVRFVNEMINTPISGINQVLTPYFQFRILGEIN